MNGAGAALRTTALLALALVAGCKPGAEEHDEARSITEFVKEQFVLRQEREPKLRPTMYFRPGMRQTELKVYGVVRPDDQNSVIELVKEARKGNSRKPVLVTFMEAEVFVEHGTMQERSGEKRLREVTVAD